MSLAAFAAKRVRLHKNATATASILEAENEHLKECLVALRSLDDEEIDRLWVAVQAAEQRYEAEKIKNEISEKRIRDLEVSLRDADANSREKASALEATILTLEESLRDADLASSHGQQELRSELSRLKKETIMHKEEASRMKKKVATLKSEIKDLGHKLDDREDTISRMKSDLKKEREEHGTEMVLEEREHKDEMAELLRRHEEEKKSLGNQLREMQELVSSMKKSHRPVLEMRDHLMGAVDSANREVEEKKATIEALTQERDKLLKDKKKWKYALMLEMQKRGSGGPAAAAEAGKTSTKTQAPAGQGKSSGWVEVEAGGGSATAAATSGETRIAWVSGAPKQAAAGEIDCIFEEKPSSAPQESAPAQSVQSQHPATLVGGSLPQWPQPVPASSVPALAMQAPPVYSTAAQMQQPPHMNISPYQPAATVIHPPMMVHHLGAAPVQDSSVVATYLQVNMAAPEACVPQAPYLLQAPEWGGVLPAPEVGDAGDFEGNGVRRYAEGTVFPADHLGGHRKTGRSNKLSAGWNELEDRRQQKQQLTAVCDAVLKISSLGIAFPPSLLQILTDDSPHPPRVADKELDTLASVVASVNCTHAQREVMNNLLLRIRQEQHRHSCNSSEYKLPSQAHLPPHLQASQPGSSAHRGSAPGNPRKASMGRKRHSSTPPREDSRRAKSNGHGRGRGKQVVEESPDDEEEGEIREEGEAASESPDRMDTQAGSTKLGSRGGNIPYKSLDEVSAQGWPGSGKREVRRMQLDYSDL